MAGVFGVLRNASVSIASTEYGAKVRKARLVPTTEVETFVPLIPAGVLADVGVPAWALELEGVQDYGASGIAKALIDGHGTTATLILAPLNATGEPEWTVSVVLMAVPFGGEQGKMATFDVTLPCVGQPTQDTVGA